MPFALGAQSPVSVDDPRTIHLWGALVDARTGRRYVRPSRSGFFSEDEVRTMAVANTRMLAGVYDLNGLRVIVERS